MFKLFLSFIIILACFTFQFGQQKEKSSIKKVVKVEGWKIPLDKKLSPTITTQNIVIDGIQIISEERSFKENFVFYYDSYQIGEDGTLYTGSLPCEPSSIASAKVQGLDKIFGYRLICSIVILDKNGKIERNTLSAYPIFYYDEDGDGKFEARYYSANPPSLPIWIKNKTENNSGN
jgi:hypothetical protein